MVEVGEAKVKELRALKYEASCQCEALDRRIYKDREYGGGNAKGRRKTKTVRRSRGTVAPESGS